ncbi:acyltransferase family protein [Arthrobacter sp. MDT2-16]
MAVVEARRPVTPRDGDTGADRRFRPEVQGLRALAVLMVVCYHIWFGRVSGGVDVFLLVSAFLLSLSFLRRVESGKPLDLARHWLHQFKRLLPAVVVVLLGTLAASYVLVPQSRWAGILEQSWASLFYVQNWVLASDAVDYYAEDHSLASPLQHFWSLSVQGQVFILWPLLFLGSSWAARRYRLKFRGVMLLVFGALFAGSLVFSIWETGTNQAYAYFDTRTRLWEFAIGTLLALALPFIRLPRFLRVLAGWVGVAAMLSGGFLLDVQGQFPGYVALWPLVAAALVIIAGQTGSRVGADRFLSSKPLVRVGDLSYALYLWHWPVLVLALIWRDRASPGVLGGLLVIAVSFALAYLTMRFVERPLRALAWADARRRRAVIVLAVCLGLVAAPLTGWQQSLRVEAERIAANADVNNPGALVLDPRLAVTAPSGVPLAPAVTDMQKEYLDVGERCSGEEAPDDSLIRDQCSTLRFSDTPDRHLVVVGSSHAQQWAVPLVELARERNWEITFFLLGACPYGLETEESADWCTDWNAAVTGHVMDLDPDAVYTVGTAARVEDPQDVVLPGFTDAANRLMDAGIQVVAVRDNPRFSQHMVQCVENEGADSPACNPSRAQTISRTPPSAQLSEEAPGLVFLDFSDIICALDLCPAVIGNVYVYIDDNHLSATYLRSMLPVFEERFDAKVRL